MLKALAVAAAIFYPAFLLLWKARANQSKRKYEREKEEHGIQNDIR